MAAEEIAILSLGVAIIAAIGTSIEWMPRYLKRRSVNWKLGVSHEPELRGELMKAFLIVWLSRAVQLGVIGLVALTRPSGATLIAMLLVFGLSFVAYLSADRARRNLLA